MNVSTVSKKDTMFITKLSSRSRSGEGQVRVRKVRFGPELYNILVFTNAATNTCSRDRFLVIGQSNIL